MFLFGFLLPIGAFVTCYVLVCLKVYRSQQSMKKHQQLSLGHCPSPKRYSLIRKTVDFFTVFLGSHKQYHFFGFYHQCYTRSVSRISL